MEDRHKLNELLPLLDSLSRQHPDDSVREMATDLRIAIATHGHVLSDALRDASQKKVKPETGKVTPEEIKLKMSEHEIEKVKAEEKTVKKTKKPLIEVISSHNEKEKVSPGSTDGQRTLTLDNTALKRTDKVSNTIPKTSDQKSELDVAFDELMDPLSKYGLRQVSSFW